MPIFICPNCGNRSESSERTAGFQTRARGCKRCGFGFLFELLDDYYPAPNAAFFILDQQGRLIGTGRGARELTGLGDLDVIGRPLDDQLRIEALNAYACADPEETLGLLQRFYDRTDEGRAG